MADDRCHNCNQPIRLVNYALGETWMHVDPAASFPTERKGSAWRHCKSAVAEPVPAPEADAPVPQRDAGVREAAHRVQAYLDSGMLPSERQSARNFDVGEHDVPLWSADLVTLIRAAVESAPATRDAEDVATLVDRSSLGTPEAKAARASVPDEHAARIAPIILCETPTGCTCGAPASTPAGMHHCDCPVHPGWCGAPSCLPCQENGHARSGGTDTAGADDE